MGLWYPPRGGVGPGGLLFPVLGSDAPVSCSSQYHDLLAGQSCGADGAGTRACSWDTSHPWALWQCAHVSWKDKGFWVQLEGSGHRV